MSLGRAADLPQRLSGQGLSAGIPEARMTIDITTTTSRSAYSFFSIFGYNFKSAALESSDKTERKTYTQWIYLSLPSCSGLSDHDQIPHASGA